MSIPRNMLTAVGLCLLAASAVTAQTGLNPVGNQIVTENSKPVTGVRILPQPDGTVWFLVPSNDRIVQLQADGVTLKQWQIRADKDIGANPVDFMVDGNIIWFIENGESLIDAGRSAFGRLDTTNGALREWNIPGSKPAAFWLTPDRSKVIIPQSAGRLQSIDLNTRVVTDYRSTKTFAYSDMVLGPDGYFWLTDFGNNRIVRYKLGDSTETSWTFFDPTQGQFNPSQIRFDDKGFLWISQLAGSQMNRFDPSSNVIVSYLGFVDPIHFDIFNGVLYVAEAPDANGDVVVMDPALAAGVPTTLAPEILTVGALTDPLPALIMDSVITPTTFTTTANAFAASDLTQTAISPGMMSTTYNSRNGYGIGVSGGTVWVGSDTMVVKLVLQTGGNASDPSAPVAAEFGVSPGVRITTDATLYNKGSAVVSGNILYFYSKGSFPSSTPFTVNPGQTLLMSDVLQSVSSNAQVLFGPVRFNVTTGTADDLSVSIRTARQLDDGSSYGYSLPALNGAASLGQGAMRTLFTGNRASEVSVFGMFSPGGASAKAQLISPDGTVRGTRQFSFAANISQEFNPAASAFGVAPEPGDVIIVSVSSGTLQPYVNVLDTGSFDIAASQPVAATQDAVIPVLGTLTGLGDTSYISDLFLSNPSFSNAANVTVSYLPLGATSPAQMFTTTLPGGGSQVIEDALGTLFGVTQGQGTLLVSADSPVAVSTRIAARKPEGDYGTFVRALDGGEAVPDGATATAFGVPQTDTRRTHLFLYNRGAAGTVTVTGFDGNGNQVGQLTVSVNAGQAVRLNSVFEQMGVEGQPTGLLTVTGTSGMTLFAQWAEVDADTGDTEISKLR